MGRQEKALALASGSALGYLNLDHGFLQFLTVVLVFYTMIKRFQKEENLHEILQNFENLCLKSTGCNGQKQASAYTNV